MLLAFPIFAFSALFADHLLQVFADDELCVDRKPAKIHARGGSGSALPKSPIASPAAQAVAKRLEKCRFPLPESPAHAPLPAECKRFAVPHCRPEFEECPPLVYPEPVTDTSAEYITKPMRLPPLRTDADFTVHQENTVFAI